MPAVGQSQTPNHVRGDGSFPPKRSPDAGDGCAANHCQPRLLLVAQLDPIADAGAGDQHLQWANSRLMHRSKAAPFQVANPKGGIRDGAAVTHPFGCAQRRTEGERVQCTEDELRAAWLGAMAPELSAARA